MKRILSILMAALLLVSAIPTAFAAEGEHDYSNGTQITLVGTQENQGAQWTVTVPAKMQPGQTGTVTAQGTWAADQFINVHAPQTVTLTYGAQSMDVAVTLGKDHGFAKIGSNTEEVTHSAEITVAEASRLFGTWEGIIEYEVAMITNGDVNRDGMITADDATMMQKAGLDFIELTEEQARYADLDGDGIASSQDGALCLRIIDNYCANTAVNAVQPVVTFVGTIEAVNSTNMPVAKLYANGVEKYTAVVDEPVSSGSQNVYNWSFTFNDVETGTYDLVVTKEAHLPYTINGVVVTEQLLDLNTLTMLCGELNGDGYINSSDIEVIQQSDNYHKKVADAATPAADLDGDGVINSSDVNIIYWQKHYDKSVADCTFTYTA